MRTLKREMSYSETECRRGSCAWYNVCLYKAAKKRLPSFTCLGCDDFVDGGELVVEDYLVQIETTYPEPPEQKGNVRALGILLSKKMRENGIPVMGFKEGQRSPRRAAMEGEE